MFEADDRGVLKKGDHLLGRRIDLVVSGGIAAIETPRLVRELRRYGAEVRVTMTSAAKNFITPLSLEWASKNRVVEDLSGQAEHISNADLVVVAPATLDFISKLSLGLADSSAATLVQTCLGRRPLFLAPSMHSSLAENPIYKENLQKLLSISGVYLLAPQEAENKSKLMEIEEMVAQISHYTSQSSLKTRSAVISLGPTRSYADDMRFLSNRSTGSLGFEIADELYRRGVRVHLVAGPLQVRLPRYLSVSNVETSEQMKESFQNLINQYRPDMGIFSAAVLDFEIANRAPEKTSSKSPWTLELRPTEKLIQMIDSSQMIRVGFKLESRLSESELLARVKDWVQKTPCEFMVANRLEDVMSSEHRAFLVDVSSHQVFEVRGKADIARKLADLLELHQRFKSKA